MTGQYIARSSAIAARRLGTSMIIMSAEDSTLFTLSETATAIWQAADGQTPLERIVEEKVCAQFDIDPAQALQDARSFVEDLAAHRILLLSDKPIRPGASAPPVEPG